MNRLTLSNTQTSQLRPADRNGGYAQVLPEHFVPIYHSYTLSEPKKVSEIHQHTLNLKEDMQMTPQLTPSQSPLKGLANSPATKYFGAKLGRINSDRYALSLKGPAFKGNDGRYISYDVETNELTDVTEFTFPNNYLVAVPATSIAAKDLIVRGYGAEEVPMYVTSVENNTVSVVNMKTGAVESFIVPTNMLGFKGYTKIVSLIDVTALGGANANPFVLAMLSGNNSMEDMLPLLMMQQNGGAIDIAKNPMLMMAMMGGSSIDPMMMMAMSGQGGIAGLDFAKNPMLALMMFGKGNIDPMMLMAMGGGNLFGAQAAQPAATTTTEA